MTVMNELFNFYHILGVWETDIVFLFLNHCHQYRSFGASHDFQKIHKSGHCLVR